MAQKVDWNSQLGRRLRLRDLHVFQIVAQYGSMARAASELRISQPAVSEVILQLEHSLGVPLLDRGPKGVEPTPYGRALLKRSVAAFDEIKQGVREIEFLSDPASGELRIGCVESVASSVLPIVIQNFSRTYPRVVLSVDQIITPTLELPRLRERSLDIVLARLPTLPPDDHDLSVEVLFEDRVVLAAGAHTKWARRRKIDLAELVDEPWILLPGENWNALILDAAFRSRGLPTPKPSVLTFSVHLRAHLLANGPFITVFPISVMKFFANRDALKILPVDLPVPPWPIAVVTLKNRFMGPVSRLFIEHLRGFIASAAVDA